MTRTIWKIALSPIDKQEVQIPDGAQLLCAREQHDTICIWFACDPRAPTVPRRIAIVGTGHPAPLQGQYLGTAHMLGGRAVFHIFIDPEDCP